MKINILLPYKEKFDENKASSVSITVRNNLFHSNYLNQIKIFGQSVENPLFKDNFIGLKYSILSLKSKNKFLAQKMLNIITTDPCKKQLLEIHNRPYLINQIAKVNEFPISLFIHNDPKTMKGSKSIRDRENILQKCAAVFCVSEYIKNLFLDGISFDNEKVHVLHNGVERNTKNFPKKQKEILFVGRLVPEKGAHFYVKAVQVIANRYPKWRFGLIGSSRLGDNQYTSPYADRVIREFNNVGSQAKFYGFKNQEFVQKKMRNSSIIVIPSLWEEPFGLVAAEAMSNGMAIIASKVGGIPEIINEGGILIEKINDLKLKNSLTDLINNKNKRMFFQKKAWENFDFSSIKSSKKLDDFRKTIYSDFF